MNNTEKLMAATLVKEASQLMRVLKAVKSKMSTGFGRYMNLLDGGDVPRFKYLHEQANKRNDWTKTLLEEWRDGFQASTRGDPQSAAFKKVLADAQEASSKLLKTKSVLDTERFKVMGATAGTGAAGLLGLNAVSPKPEPQGLDKLKALLNRDN